MTYYQAVSKSRRNRTGLFKTKKGVESAVKGESLYHGGKIISRKTRKGYEGYYLGK